MKQFRTVWTPDRTCSLRLERRGSVNWHCQFRGISYEFIHITESYSPASGVGLSNHWNVLINGECTDSYRTLATAVANAIGYGLEFGRDTDGDRLYEEE